MTDQLESSLFSPQIYENLVSANLSPFDFLTLYTYICDLSNVPPAINSFK
jgi:hypothetical protein